MFQFDLYIEQDICFAICSLHTCSLNKNYCNIELSGVFLYSIVKFVTTKVKNNWAKPHKCKAFN